MEPNSEQIAIMVGALTSAVLWLLKVVSPRYETSATVAKLLPAVLLPVLTLGFAAHWQGGLELLWSMVLGVVSSLGSYGIIGRQALDSIREDREGGGDGE